MVMHGQRNRLNSVTRKGKCAKDYCVDPKVRSVDITPEPRVIHYLEIPLYKVQAIMQVHSLYKIQAIHS
jgi:hypothetical protein